MQLTQDENVRIQPRESLNHYFAIKLRRKAYLATRTCKEKTFHFTKLSVECKLVFKLSGSMILPPAVDAKRPASPLTGRTDTITISGSILLLSARFQSRQMCLQREILRPMALPDGSRRF
jgi:hypothetical protein